ncbi:uncharacterized protein LOC142616327 [Castanea sativa]|uniref:uncharacterized protein LOC142616327 n=1 Tax=Castanea sativa TaxID=21020 RepID=UPI003F64FF7A
MPRRFTCPPFTICDGKNDSVEHVNYYIQMMSLYSQNDGLMFKLVKARHLKEFVVGQGEVNIGQDLGSRNNNALSPPLGVIGVIHATSMRVSVSRRRGILSVVTPPEADSTDRPENKLKRTSVSITFGEANLEGTSQPHDDALVVTSRIGGLLVKRVLVDQGSRGEIMYPDLYKGLWLKPEDLSKYDTPMGGFDGKVVMPKGLVKLSVVTEGKEVKVKFIVVNAFSLYTMILGWL